MFVTNCLLVAFVVAISIGPATLLRTRASSLRHQRTTTDLKPAPNSTYNYKVNWYNQTLDHFGFTTDLKFPQKYLTNDTWWDVNGGPIFFYTGNEGRIEAFAENSGFMWEIAEEFKAMLVFAEHRYYGESLPFGKNSSSKDPKIVGFLSSEQALGDYADLVTYIKSTVKGAESSAVVAFGGSYGGMLAAWFRLKFPHICAGAIAASAPVAQFAGLTPCDAFGRIVTSDYSAAAVNNTCSASIRSSWTALDRMGEMENNTGIDWINKNWHLCEPLTHKDNITDLKYFLTDLWTNLAMMDYPYPTSFLAPLPANPVNAACKSLALPHANDTELLSNVFTAISVYFNYTGNTTCLDIGQEDAIGADMWSYQACSEMVMPFCYDGTNDMFEKTPWDPVAYAKQCEETWGVTPRPMMAQVMYGGRNLEGASNIVFSNGLLDPWSSGGVLKSQTKNVVAVIIPEGAHHLDLRSANSLDPDSVKEARKVERQFIKKWLASEKAERNSYIDIYGKKKDNNKKG